MCRYMSRDAHRGKKTDARGTCIDTHRKASGKHVFTRAGMYACRPVCMYTCGKHRLYGHTRTYTLTCKHAIHSNTCRCVCLHVKVYVLVCPYRRCLPHVYMHTGLHAYMPARVNTCLPEAFLCVSIHVPRASVFLPLCASLDMYLHILVHHLLVLWP
jgi:hypothetical protein